jgi:hypothetical protein
MSHLAQKRVPVDAGGAEELKMEFEKKSVAQINKMMAATPYPPPPPPLWAP